MQTIYYKNYNKYNHVSKFAKNDIKYKVLNKKLDKYFFILKTNDH